MKWEVSSFRWTHGSFVEAAKARSLEGEPGEWWVERLHPDLKPEHRARVLRRWWLAAQLTARAWPAIKDAGDDAGQPWAVIEAPGRRPDGAFPYADPKVALREVRSIALALADAEALLLEHYTVPRLSLRPSLLARDDAGRMHLHLAALDTQPDLGFPATPQLTMFTPEELLGHPTTARTNVYALGWLLALALTGKWPYAAQMHDAKAGTELGESTAREALRPLILTGKVITLGLHEALKPAEAIVRRALSPQPHARFATSAAFAEALAPLAPPTEPDRERGARIPEVLRPPPFDVTNEALPAEMETKLLSSMDDSSAWVRLARELDELRSPRADLIRAQLRLDAKDTRADERERALAEQTRLLALPGVTPSLAGEKLGFKWKAGYVRTLEASTESGKDLAPAELEARSTALAMLLQHASLRFVQELRLLGPKHHLEAWLEALHRAAPASLKRIEAAAVDERSPEAVDLAFRFPRWTWAWGAHGGGGSGLASRLKKLFGR